MSALSCTGLRIDIGGRRLIEDLTLDIAPGEFVAVLGENGAGKTLALHTFAGLREPSAGAVKILDRPLTDWPRRARAQALALLVQTSEDPFPSTVLEAATIGRHPHIDFWRWENEDDIRLTREALAAVGLTGMDTHEVQTLSGGERRRVAIATALAQDARIYLLDEPTNHLDPHHQLEALRLFRARADSGCTVIATLHDATLAAQFSDRTLLLFGDGRWVYGASGDVLSATNLSRLYNTPIEQIEHRGRRIFIGA